ncbi:MAG: oxalyl-CoA decarboxylase [Chloroflexi bacterium HGW-Chloroflexi-9]|uniref:Oxalyl-CoA decarboxylase n=1 Tax=Chloroflexi bacterium HGW-Chloroflexi-9 TaxID=2013732 RepID=A0ACD6BA56_9CHLR|nr:MAG: oxalyl-CoA decarboxylase [Chloroflexi bacterium HGW-Chloroflexi-9]
MPEGPVAEIDGQTIIARALKQQGVEAMFGVVGIPVTGIAAAAQREGIKYVGMRHEMPATYAAQAVSYLGGRLGTALAVSGPGVLNAVAAFANAWSNRWPMILIGGSYEQTGHLMGFFQEADQLSALKPYAKYAERVERLERIPIYVAEAVKKALHGVPGPAYLELPGDIITAKIDESKVEWAPRVPDPKRTLSDPADVEAAIAALKTAQQPLIIVGKGVAASRAEVEIRAFVEKTGIPYLAMPMAKGLIPDDHDQSAAAARSFVLQNADLIFLVGARLNWMLHFGLPPRFRPDVRVVQLDFNPEEIGINVPTEVGMIGDAKATLSQLLDVLDRDGWRFPDDSEWVTAVSAEARQNAEAVQAMMQEDTQPLGYYRALRSIDERLPKDAIFVAEGASTMDISRTVINQYLPRTRLDAGSFGSMGLGHGFAIGAATQFPGKRVICLQGDGAFGFAGTECEVAVRYNLPITWIVFNNGGIGGHRAELFERDQKPVGGMSLGARYDILMQGLGGAAFNATNSDELDAAIEAALKIDGPSLINVPLDPDAKRKPQKFGWLTRTNE